MVRSRRPLGILAAGTGALLVLVAGCSSGSDVAARVTPSVALTIPSATPIDTSTPSPPSESPSPTPSPTVSARPKPKPSPTHAQTVPVSHSAYAFPIRCSSGVSYGHSHHDYPATDMFAAVGCSVVSPVTGTVDEVSRVDTWSSSKNLGSTRGGLSFSIVGVDGVRYYGSHLSSILSTIKPGVHVVAGQLIGKVGRSGDARGGASHLHFGISWPTGSGIWWVRRGEVYPWPYLDAWRKGIAKSPAAAVAKRKAQVGNAPCSVDC